MRRLAMATALLVLCLFAAPPTASAFNPFGNVDCNNGNGSAVCTDKGQPAKDANGNPINPIAQEMHNITNIVAYVGGAAAIIVIIISALKFITSGSDVSTGSRTDTDIENARRGLANATIGLVVIILARYLIIFVLNRL